MFQKIGLFLIIGLLICSVAYAQSNSGAWGYGNSDKDQVKRMELLYPRYISARLIIELFGGSAIPPSSYYGGGNYGGGNQGNNRGNSGYNRDNQGNNRGNSGYNRGNNGNNSYNRGNSGSHDNRGNNNGGFEYSR